MRITREYLFDMVELVGTAVATARRRQADDSWLIDDMLDFMIRKYDLTETMVDEEAQKEDWGVVDDSQWKSKDEASTKEERLDLDKNGWSVYGAEGFEMKKAQKAKDEFGEVVAWQLRTIQRAVAFKDIGVIEGLKRLQELCNHLRKTFISEGWANRLAAIIDSSCRGR